MDRALSPSASSRDQVAGPRDSSLPLPVRPPLAILASDRHSTASLLPIASRLRASTPADAGREPLQGGHPLSSSSPPPPYTGDSSRLQERPSVTALTFFLLDAELSAASRRPTAMDGLVDPSIADTFPPAYAEMPRTQAEHLFWFGWLLPPFLWIVGASRIWRTETTRLVGDKERSVSIRCDGDAGSDVLEAVERWREEELVWARRRLWALIGSLLLVALLGVMLASVTGRM